MFIFFLKQNELPPENLFPIPEGGWAYDDCFTLRYEGDDVYAKGSEDIVHFKDDIYFVSTGLYGENPPPATTESDLSSRAADDDESYKLGGIYILDTSSEPPKLKRAEISGLPASINLRPHGFFLDHESGRLFLVSHNNESKEENIIILAINDNDDEYPSFQFDVALYSSQWAPVGMPGEAWHLNDVVYAGNNEILTTKFGPQPRENPFEPKRLWSCTIQEVYDNVPEHGRVETICTQALNFTDTQQGIVGLNGITISDDKQTVWTSDISFAQILQIGKNDTTGNWHLQDTIPVPAIVDNVEYIDGTLHMGAGTKHPAYGGNLAKAGVGGYLVGEKKADGSHYNVSVVFQFSGSFLAELGDGGFSVSEARPVGASGQYLALGSYDFPGLVLCKSKNEPASTNKGKDMTSSDAMPLHWMTHWVTMFATIAVLNLSISLLS